MAKGLTKKQQMILQYILDYVQKEGYPPSIREIGRDFQIGSLRGVTVHLDALERKGYISRSNTPRSIKVIHPAFQTESRVQMLPLLGSIAAGVPIAAQEHIEEMVPVPTEMVRHADGAFVLRVKGDSMIGDGILPFDLVVIRPQRTANQGEIIAALLGDEATVKRIDFTTKGVKLVSSNPAYEPIPIEREDAQIIGRVVGLIRDYDGRAF
ncbi:MAG TPA: transcriptional repressor LexA [Fimbriimonas sp.]|nr:transcriptional repressor LexA [Fimbriimonas sp.]